MQRAADMLAARGLTVREVAHRVGYRQPAQFAKAFRRYQGVAPVGVPVRSARCVRRAAPRPSACRPAAAAASALRPLAPGRAAAWRARACAVPFVGSVDICSARSWPWRSAPRHPRAVTPPPRRPRPVAPAGGDRRRRVGARHRPRARSSTGSRPPASEQARADRHAVGRPADRVGPDLRARLRRWSSTRSTSGACARARRSSTARRSTATRGSRSSGPRIPAILLVCARRLRLRRADRHRGRQGRRDAGPRRRRAVRLDVLLPGAEQGGKEIAATQLYLPAGRQVEFNVQSKDVIHDFWVPAFRMKIDAVRGITTRYRVDTDRARATTRSSAPSSAGSGTRRCARPCTSLEPRGVRRVDGGAGPASSRGGPMTARQAARSRVGPRRGSSPSSGSPSRRP